MSASGFVTIVVLTIFGETEKAFYMELEDGSKHWIPKSQIADPDDYELGDEDLEISITEWFAKERGLEVKED